MMQLAKFKTGEGEAFYQCFTRAWELVIRMDPALEEFQEAILK